MITPTFSDALLRIVGVGRLGHRYLAVRWYVTVPGVETPMAVELRSNMTRNGA